MTNAEENLWRSRVVFEAKTWIRTPYQLNQGLKGCGVDCARFVFEVYRVCKLIADENIGIFGADWSAHERQEVYIFRMLRHAHKVAEGISYPTHNWRPGNVVLVKTNGGRVYDHAGIVSNWPKVIHAAPEYVKEIDASTHWLWASRYLQVFDPWEKIRSDF